MEIQTFFLAEQVIRLADNRDDIRRGHFASGVCTGTVFPSHIRRSVQGVFALFPRRQDDHAGIIVVVFRIQSRRW